MACRIDRLGIDTCYLFTLACYHCTTLYATQILPYTKWDEDKTCTDPHNFRLQYFSETFAEEMCKRTLLI